MYLAKIIYLYHYSAVRQTIKDFYLMYCLFSI